MIPKSITLRDPKYLDWIRTLPCMLCGKSSPSEAHHTASGGMGIKGSDYSCIAVCRDCHSVIHNTGGKASFCDSNILEQTLERLQEVYNTQIKGEK